MNTNQAKQLFEEIVELCYETENPRLIELLEDIYPEVQEATDLSKIQSCLEELQVLINEIDLTDEEEELTLQISQKIEMLSE